MKALLRRWGIWPPKIRLASLLWLMLVAGLLISWHRDRQQLLAEFEARTNPRPRWGAIEATGAPDTLTAGDIPTAWASATPDGQPEWLELKYRKAAIPAAIAVHASYNPGALVKITAFDPLGREYILWEGIDPTAPGSGSGVSRIKVAPQFKTDRVRIYLDSPAVAGWNEIDAVGMIDANGKNQWAVDAKASSNYASAYSGYQLPPNFNPTPPMTFLDGRLIGTPIDE